MKQNKKEKRSTIYTEKYSARYKYDPRLR